MAQTKLEPELDEQSADDWISAAASQVPRELPRSAVPDRHTGGQPDEVSDASDDDPFAPAPRPGWRVRRAAKKRAIKKARAEAERARRRRRPPLLRGRVLARTVLGLSLLILFAGLGAAVSGTLLYVNYQYRRDQSDALVRDFDGRVANATELIAAQRTNAQAEIQAELEPIRALAATGQQLTRLVDTTQPSVWAVRTFDSAGQPVVGTAFVVASDSERSFLLTSYSVVHAGTERPGPELTLTKGEEELEAELWTWDETNDIALLILAKPGLPRIDWAPSGETRLGDRVFAVSGWGGSGAAVTQGFVADVSASGLQHDARLGPQFSGGPIVNGKGQVVALASRTYAPLGFEASDVWFAPPISVACDKVLSCPGGRVAGAGARR